MATTPEFYFTETLYGQINPPITERTTNNPVTFRCNVEHLRGIGGIIQRLTSHQMIGAITADTFVFYESETEAGGPAIYPSGEGTRAIPAESQPPERLLIPGNRIPLGYPISEKTEAMLPAGRQATTLGELRARPARYILEVPTADPRDGLVAALARAMTYSACVSTPFHQPKNRFGWTVNPDRAAAKAARRASKKYPQAVTIDNWHYSYR